MSFRAGEDGQFHVEVLVDNVRMRFMVDTGAGYVVLSPADARRLGFDLTRLDFTITPPEAAQEISDALPRDLARFECLAHCRHGAFRDDPEMTDRPAFCL